MEKILVTGGAGYIGSHTCIELIKEGYEIIVADNLSNSSSEVVKRIEELSGQKVAFYKVDICDREELRKIFSKHNINSVIHFAGYKAVGESVSFPLKYYHNNLISTITLCEIMNEYDVKRLVFSSSATVYGDPEYVPIKEDARLQATNPYGRTKLMIEDMLRDLAKSDKEWSIVSLRYFNPVGAHESGRIGEDPAGIPNNLMPYISQVAIGRLECLNVFGDDYPTDDGTGIRDYIHVTDLALGHCRALEYSKNNKGSIEINLGTGKGYSVLDLVKSFEKVTGKKIPYKIVSRRPGDVAKSFADPGKALELLGWNAQYGLDKMCEDSWRWQTENPRGYE